jgi:predicted NUDIX family phosphoesterase
MEFVYVAPREALFPTSTPHGFRPFAGEDEARQWLSIVKEHGFFVERPRAERTPAWKQIIPYCVVATEGRVLLMKRRAKGGEARLHDKLTIGVGGHINPIDVDDAAELVLAGARREIAEEIELVAPYELRLVGTINDDTNPVGAVHLGLVFTVNTPGPVTIREQDVLEGDLVDAGELRARLARGENYESWSAMLVRELDALALEQPATTWIDK